MKQQINHTTGLTEIIISAIIKSIDEEVKYNALEYPYRLCTVQIEYPNGTTAVTQTILWENVYKEHKTFFDSNSSVYINIQAEGEYEGFSSIVNPNEEIYKPREISFNIGTNEELNYDLEDDIDDDIYDDLDDIDYDLENNSKKLAINNDAKADVSTKLGKIFLYVCAIIFCFFIINTFFSGLDNVKIHWVYEIILSVGFIFILVKIFTR